MFYITGDTHRDFGRIEDFRARMGPSPEDVMIVLGDAGINSYGCKAHSALLRPAGKSLGETSRLAL